MMKRSLADGLARGQQLIAVLLAGVLLLLGVIFVQTVAVGNILSRMERCACPDQAITTSVTIVEAGTSDSVHGRASTSRRPPSIPCPSPCGDYRSVSTVAPTTPTRSSSPSSSSATLTKPRS